ncbi:MGDG synthase family glycosyltransferase [Ornithinibacillus xuwenensis]|jgi:processive 1,2-diacylglycerol beta-glucosyltransferase|uniref:Glycosyltransferase n=1 Tax=Ornithinibacillus xuwenensis TaxID=3144668 RepID=A0ABU9XJT3_9BACI
MDTKPKDEALFLPFMQIPTGHHHVADAVIEELQLAIETFNCEKVDILSYSYGKMERLVSATYLSWIKKMPKAYDWLYNYLAVKNQTKRSRQLLYEAMFTPYFKRLINENEPRILFCTHALPSNISSILKCKNKLRANTVNVYTDFFINRVWGIEGIDYHFVPSITVKKFLLELGVDESTIYVTGIPVHPVFLKPKPLSLPTNQIHVLITGGSLGVGSIEKLIPENPTVKYSVLCGKNERLYHNLRRRNHPSINPIPYVSSKVEMNEIYNQADAVITKPGGVTISECLMKHIPVFTGNALPGQEKVNERQLKELGVILTMDTFNESIEKQVIDFFEDEMLQKNYREKLETYHNHLENRPLSAILQEICSTAE